MVHGGRRWFGGLCAISVDSCLSLDSRAVVALSRKDATKNPRTGRRSSKASAGDSGSSRASGSDYLCSVDYVWPTIWNQRILFSVVRADHLDRDAARDKASCGGTGVSQFWNCSFPEILSRAFRLSGEGWITYAWGLGDGLGCRIRSFGAAASDPAVE